MALFTWGPLIFDVQPLNINETDHATDSDWARKEIVGARIFREWVGENDEEITLRGRVFPYRIGGLAELDIMENMRFRGTVELLTRGAGLNNAVNMGWYVIEKLARAHRHLTEDGVGQMIQFEASFARMPPPSGLNYYTVLYRSALMQTA